MARNIAFVDREGNFISEKDWREKSNDPSYWTVRQYDNGVVQIVLKWNGRIQNPGDMYREYWPVFILLVKNYRSDGGLATDPESDKTFPNEAAGLEAYMAFLGRWTESHVDDASGEFVEEGNTLELPKAPDPNQPATESDLPGGAW